MTAEEKILQLERFAVWSRERGEMMHPVTVLALLMDRPGGAPPPAVHLAHDVVYTDPEETAAAG